VQAPANVPRAPEVQPPGRVWTAAAPRPADTADTGTLDQYRVALLGAANRYKRYPAIAMEKGWAGRVDVRIVIGANGMTQSIVVKTSSGFEVLDKTAVDMVTKAKPMTPIPPSLRGREFTVDIPVIFSLQTG
jgi:protein TonB